MSQSERDAIAAICLMAAFADGQPDDRERARIKTVIDGLATDAGAPGAGVSNQVYQRVIFRQTDAAREAGQLSTPELKKLAYEMAVSVCDADGAASPSEKKFLADLAAACGISPEEAARHQSTVDQMSVHRWVVVGRAHPSAARPARPCRPPPLPPPRWTRTSTPPS